MRMVIPAIINDSGTWSLNAQKNAKIEVIWGKIFKKYMWHEEE